jgi:hypothetical protein
MKRLAAAWGSVFLLTLGGMAAEEPYPPKGAYNNSVHRFFPDLDARLNAVRYGRWRAVEMAWISGINAETDRAFSRWLTALLKDPPRFAPEADLVAPRLAREAAPIFLALRWGQVFEQQILDTLAAPDASPRTTEERLTRIYDLYRRERWALTAPGIEIPPTDALNAAPASAHLLQVGTRLFALAAEDLAAADFGQQRWRVRKTVEEFDHSFALGEAPENPRYRTAAPTVFERFPHIADALDRLSRFRGALFEALLPGGQTRETRGQRDEAVRHVAVEWGLPVKGIGGR